MSKPISLLSGDVCCATCAFSHHWEETRRRSAPITVRRMGFSFREYKEEVYTANGIQCLRYPAPMDTDAEHGCGEYRAAQGIEAGTAETVKLGSVHESPVAESDAPNPNPFSPSRGNEDA
jgi:hypothetical protein